MEEIYFELKSAYGKDAEFGNGQLEAIQGVLSGKRTLVVQKPAGGKVLYIFYPQRY